MANLILIVEDEPKLSQSMSEYLIGSGYKVHVIDNGLDVSDWVKVHAPSLIVLDLMLPGKDGITICQELRAYSQVPIIMVTAKTEEVDRLVGLELGADDYICKPFSLRELVARIKAVLRRHEYVPQDKDPSQGLTLDKSRGCVSYNGETIELTAIEFNILEKMSRNPGRIFTRDDLINSAYEDSRVVNDRTVDSHMKKIRQKLKKIAPNEKFVHSIYGAGYKFEP